MLKYESIGLKFYSLWDYSLSKLNPNLIKSLELFVEISVVIWRSLIHYTRYILMYDLISLPSEISILGDHFPMEEDIEEDPGEYVTEDTVEDVAEDIFGMMDPSR
jgi:hypothetical protein